MQRVATNLIDCEAGFLLDDRYLIHDRDPLFNIALGETLKRANVNPVKLPARSPNLDAYAERFLRSAKSECVGQVILLCEHHLRRVVCEDVEHDYCERTQQGLRNRLIDHDAARLNRRGEVECHRRLGGLLRDYERAA